MSEESDHSLVLYSTEKAKSATAGDVAVISLNRPKAANAQSLALIYALDDALQKALSERIEFSNTS